MTITIVPSAPGFYVLERCVGDDPATYEGYVRVPIVAWAVETIENQDREYTADPVTPDFKLAGRCFILSPDGAVTEPCGSSWDDLEKWRADPEVWKRNA